MDGEVLTADELVALGAVDAEFYCTQFFPKTVRQPFAEMHHDAWAKLESNARLVNLLMYRGSGKTTHCRLYTSKSIAYAQSNTILYTGKSEGHAIRSTSWIKNQVENNLHWAETFGIQKGQKWQDTEFEILVGGGGDMGPQKIWVMAAGITGSIRGVNRDDYRPDLIVLDDVLDDENAHTDEQRTKIERLVYGALMESLAPKSEAPHAKMIGLNTPQNKEDFTVKALKDPGWLSAVYGCWTKETSDLPVDFQEASWPERTPSEELRKEKKRAAARNQLATFQREKECKLTSPDTAKFRAEWLKYYKQSDLPEGMIYSYAIDPVPAPTQAQVEKGLTKRDFEAHVIWGARGNDRYLIEYRLMRGHEPTWTIATFFELQQKYNPFVTVVETVAFATILSWLLRKAMDARRMYYPIKEVADKRKKFTRIITAHNGPAVAGRLHVRQDQTEFLEQFSQYSDVPYDDLLDASAFALMELEGMFVTEEGTLATVNEIADVTNRPVRLAKCP